MPLTSSRHIPHITGIWWFQEEKPIRESTIPDIFRRNNIIVSAFFSFMAMLVTVSIDEDRNSPLDTEDFTAPRSLSGRCPKDYVRRLVPTRQYPNYYFVGHVELQTSLLSRALRHVHHPNHLYQRSSSLGLHYVLTLLRLP